MSQIDLPRRHHLDAITSERWTASDQNRWTPSVRYAWTASLESAGKRAAAIYTVVTAAKFNGLNPEAYLKDVLTRIADGHPINRIDELLPWRMVIPLSPRPE